MKEKQKAQAEVDRLIQTDNDMFEKYLKKPATSSVGFFMLSQQRDRSCHKGDRDRSNSPIFSNNDTLESDFKRKVPPVKYPVSSYANRKHITIHTHSN